MSDVPALETFTPDRSYRVLGADYLILRHPDGVRLDLSETGVAKVNTDPEVAALIVRMGEFIAKYGVYKATMDVPDREPCDMPVVAETRATSRDWHRGLRLASVYHPHNAPNVILKAFVYDRRSTLSQFYLGAWLHDRLDIADDGINSPAQLAMLRSGATGCRTTVMDYMPGKSLYDIARRLGMDDDYEEDILVMDNIAQSFGDSLRQKVAHMTGWRGFLVANDLSTTSNIIDPDPETVTPYNLAEREQVGIIDQPVINKGNILLQTIARYAPVQDDKPRPTETIELPAASSL